MFARTTSIVVILATVVTLFSIASASPIPGEIQKRQEKAKPDIAGFVKDVATAAEKNLGISIPDIPIPDIPPLPGTPALPALPALPGAKSGPNTSSMDSVGVS
ncbi:hypothetical protein FBU30_001548 [Linnemannia zychae]|nr:hypothetical protein FBU30_001548 [Linnemannia zychae]